MISSSSSSSLLTHDADNINSSPTKRINSDNKSDEVLAKDEPSTLALPLELQNSNDGGEGTDENQRLLTRTEIRNLVMALLAWACTVSTVTIVVGTSAVVLLSVGGDDSLTSLPLGTFVLGSSLVSLLITPWLFERYGRKRGFGVGILIGLCGTVLGCASILTKSVALLVLATFLFGAAMGVGFFLRFAAVELVPHHWQARAVTLVVSGGVVAAFAGPESAQGMKDAIGGDDSEFLGTFVMTGIFGLCNALCIGLIRFPEKEDGGVVSPSQQQDSEETKASQKQLEHQRKLKSILKSRQFLVPMLVAALAWASMAMPMSIVRVVMAQVGFSSRQSLTVIELHFCGMYAPGFWTGSCISRFGSRPVAVVGVCTFALALAFNFAAQENNDSADMTFWILGLFTVGVAWNMCFTSATVWTTALYDSSPELKPLVQAANDFGMFFVSGVWIVSASYIFDAGGGGLEGWHLLNFVVVGLVGLMATVLVLNRWLDQRERLQERNGLRQTGEYSTSDLSDQAIEEAQHV